MGRKKISISRIKENNIRKSTFEKRRVGLLKKAMELSILCDVPVSVTMEDPNGGEFCLYSSQPYELSVIHKFENLSHYRLFTNEHFRDMIPGRYSKDTVGHKVTKTPSMRLMRTSSTSAISTDSSMDADLPPPITIKPIAIKQELTGLADYNYNTNVTMVNMVSEVPPFFANNTLTNYAPFPVNTPMNGMINGMANLNWMKSESPDLFHQISVKSFSPVFLGHSPPSGFGTRRSFDDMMEAEKELDDINVNVPPLKKRKLSDMSDESESNDFNFKL